MSGALEPLSAAARMSDPDFPGVVCVLPKGWRLVVNMDCTAYRLQSRGQTADGCEVWFSPPGRAPATVAKLLEKHGGQVEGLAAALSGLPADPARAVPEFQARRALLLGQFRATDWRTESYGRVVRQDANLRLVVEPSGDLYRLQWLKRARLLAGPSDRWLTLRIAPDLASIRFFLTAFVYEQDEGPDPERLADRLDALFADLPPIASVGVWSVVPPRPVGRAVEPTSQA
jgi:hypothetical protein